MAKSAKGLGPGFGPLRCSETHPNRSEHCAAAQHRLPAYAARHRGRIMRRNTISPQMPQSAE
ncbi:MAG: hypothetical protein DCC68_13120 [Planctomycetota bacterium]|nr:MAG: hypothetical protein DCC68_13120 [Planctomycetota bacterium]